MSWDDVRPDNIGAAYANGSGKRSDAWRRGLILNERGEPRRNLANVMHVMASHHAWGGVIAYDAFREIIAKVKAPPVRPQDGESAAGEWTEADSARTCAWFAAFIGFEPTTMHVDQAVAAVAERNTIHPVRDYFGGLTWDGVERLDEMLTSYFGALSDPYTRAVGSRWMISAVARVMAPGCQADCMIVLEGRQGTGKSTGLEALASQEWFADTGISIGEKDSYQALRGVWIYELGELDSLRGREATRTKMFLSARTDTYRPSYGRRTRNFPRQTVFAGSTNESEYLVDKTGNRRFWPIRCGAIDVAAIRRDRDQLWAEALVRYKQGDAWHLNTPELCRLADAAQEARETEDPWVPTIDRWLTSLSPVVRLEGITTDMVLAALQVPAASQHHGAVTRAGQAMRALGWEPQQLRRGGARVRIYRPAQPAQPDTAGTEADGVTGSPLENKGNTHLSHPSQAHALYAGTRRGESLNAIMCRDGRTAVTPAALEAAQEGFDFNELEAFETDQGVR